MSDDEKPRRRRRRRPATRTREEEEEAQFFRLLGYAWDIIPHEERSLALHCAVMQGEVLAKEFGGMPPGVAPGDFADAYRRSGVRAALEARIINETEYECWRYETRDPRIKAFESGMRRILGPSFRAKARPPAKRRSSRRLAELGRLVQHVRRYVESGGDAHEWLKRVQALGAVSDRTMRALRERLEEEGLLE